MIEAGEEARTGIFQHVAGRRVLAQIDREVEPVRPKLLRQFLIVLHGQFAFAKL